MSDSDGGSTRPSSAGPETVDDTIKNLEGLCHYVIEELAENMSDGQPRDSDCRAKFLDLRQQVRDLFSQLSGELRDATQRKWSDEVYSHAKAAAKKSASLLGQFWTWFKQKLVEIATDIDDFNKRVLLMWARAEKRLINIVHKSASAHMNRYMSEMRERTARDFYA